MRESGLVMSARGLLPLGHLCWGFTNRADFLTRAAEYAADGIRAGQRVDYVADRSSDELRAELCGLGEDIARAVMSGDAGVLPVRAFLGLAESDQVVDPAAALRALGAVADAALARGYPGYRAVVDCTALARTSEQRAAFARLEYLLDQKMSALPVTALCAYDVTELGAAGVAEVACLHPYIQAGTTPFHLYADEGVAFHLAGELDLAGQDLFVTTLRRILPMTGDAKVIVDARALEFIGHRALLALDNEAVAHDRRIILRGAPSIVDRVARLLPLRELRVEQVA